MPVEVSRRRFTWSNADKAKDTRAIVNALFYSDNCDMVYGDAAAVLTKMIEAVRGLGLKAAA